MALHTVIAINRQHAELTREGSHLSEFWQPTGSSRRQHRPRRQRAHRSHLCPPHGSAAIIDTGPAWNQRSTRRTNGISGREPEPWRRRKEAARSTGLQRNAFGLVTREPLDRPHPAAACICCPCLTDRMARRSVCSSSPDETPTRRFCPRRGRSIAASPEDAPRGLFPVFAAPAPEQRRRRY